MSEYQHIKRKLIINQRFNYMNKNNYCFNISVSSEQSIELPEIVNDEIVHTISDQDIITLTVRDENNLLPIIPVHIDETSIEMGDCEPLEIVTNITVAINDSSFDNQPVELDAHYGQPTDEILHLLYPINLYIAEGLEVPFSPAIQILDVTIHMNIAYDNILLNEQEILLESMKNENNERTSIQRIENTIRYESINGFHNFSSEPTVVIDLTQNENDNERMDNFNFVDISNDHFYPKIYEEKFINVVSPVVIDLTQDDYTEEEIQQFQLLSTRNHIDQTNQTETSSPIMNETSLLIRSSLEANNEHTNIANETDNSDQTIETTAQLQISILSSWKNKRSNSLNELCYTLKKRSTDRIKRYRVSLV